jgi:8-oxo-dGTP diphosphatase
VGDAHDRGRRAEAPEPRRWLVGGGLVVADQGVLLVQNRRRDGRLDWSPPGGVIDAGESLVEGLTREVEEETGLRVHGWAGPAYRIRAHAPDMGWHLEVEAHLAEGFDGELRVDDPDGIVVAARFVGADECVELLGHSPRWVREPLCAWLADRVAGARHAYRVEGGPGVGPLSVTRLDPSSAG